MDTHAHTAKSRHHPEGRTGAEREELFRKIYNHYHRSVLAFFRKLGYSEPDCDDLTQQCFLQVFQSLGRFRREVALHVWVFRIATNVYRKAVRKRYAAKRAGNVVSFEDFIGSRAGQEEVPRPSGPDHGTRSNSPGPLRRAIGKERLKTVILALDDLPGQTRRCVLLRMQGFSLREIGVTLGISPHVAKARLHRARVHLRYLRSTLTSSQR